MQQQCQILLKTHQVRSIYDTNRDETAFLQWDADGQLQAVTRPCSADLRYHWWNDAGQLASMADNEHCGFYGYDGDGNRTYKLTGYSLVDSYNAGTERLGLYLSDAVLYVNPYMVVTTRGYTKHYYDGSQRIAAQIGDLADLPDNVVDTSTVALERLANARAYMTSLLNTTDTLAIDTASVSMDIAGNVPDKLQWQCTDDNKWSLNTVVHCDSNILLPAMRKDSAVMAHQASGTYCYHSDHLGSATWITTKTGQPVEYLHYMPYGELWRDQRTTSYSERFRFTGKERDTETGYDYFGARYYSSTLPTWLSVDPLSDKYPNISPYAYCNWNPVKNVDPDGEGPKDRVYLAQEFVNTKVPYKQETNAFPEYLRTNVTPEALAYMDCSELVCRVMAGDGMTATIESHNTKDLLENIMSDSNKFIKSDVPQTGDIVLWNGHTGIVESFDEDKVTVLHSTRYGERLLGGEKTYKANSACREKYSLNYYKIKNAYFYRPVNETPDVLDKEYRVTLPEIIITPNSIEK